MVASAPLDSYRPDGESAAPAPVGRSLEDFKKLMADMTEIQKNKNKAVKERKRQEQMVKRKSMADQFKRVQRYLGLRPTTQGGECILSCYLLGTNIVKPPLLSNLLSLFHSASIFRSSSSVSMSSHTKRITRKSPRLVLPH
jgi:hypothetical protein